MARQPGPTAREIESSQLVDVIAKPSRVDDIAPDFSRLCTGQKPVAVFLNDFFCGTVPANLERIAPARWTIDAAESNRAIFSDDPDATEKLVDKIERLKQRQGAMKRANQLIRKADREGLADLGFSEETITRLFSQDYAGRVGFPNYALTNNSANIRRLEKRLAAIQNAQDDETTEEQFPGGVRLVNNVEANRLQIFFPEIPSEEIRRELKRNGFHWSPTAGAWQRHRSNRATYLAKLILTNHTR